MFGRKNRTSPNIIDKKNKKMYKLKMSLFIILMFLLVIYLVLKVVYTGGKFTVSLDKAGDLESSLVIFEKLDEKNYKRTLSVDTLEFMTNISVNWIPKDINNEADGAHNGKNYIAYTFYIENQGDRTIDYWYTIAIDDIIKNADEAIRVMIFINDEKTIYAKANRTTGQPEEGTEPFYSEDFVAINNREGFKSGDVDKCTIVIWIEGDDPQCIDDLIGGEMKMHMEIAEEHIQQ